MTQLRADVLLLLATVGWGASYLLMKMGLDAVGEFTLIALRFGIAFLIAAAVFSKRLRHTNFKTIKYALLLGFLLFLVFVTVTYGLNTTTTTNAGFLVSLTVIFVPLFSIFIFKKKLELRLLLSILIALTGIALLTIHPPFKIMTGDLLCIGTALFYALHITVAGVAAKEVDTLNVGILQLGFASLYGLVFSFIFETPTFPSTLKGWFAVLTLAIVCSGFGFIIQIVAQKYTSPTRTGLIFSLEPVFAAIFGYVFAHEIMSINGYIGAFLVFLSVIISSVKSTKNQVVAEERVI
ncbi:DMT family transporter [Schinkia azotoformans]|uniref:DMT family transporter n=1 Tax=Schinkia azotoformans TaxID=1454 RepID=UPI002DB75DB1|nr:DMT family transporter [Schinkia azotoformans]MEC1722817.1 DMT family transporter [Schinkia azotoformans]MED4413137.1 DMT family transporter [Schinkia azotoformans]